MIDIKVLSKQNNRSQCIHIRGSFSFINYYFTHYDEGKSLRKLIKY